MNNLIEQLESRNPYPESVFVPVPQTLINTVNNYIAQCGHTPDGFYGSLFRDVWNNFISELKKIITENSDWKEGFRKSYEALASWSENEPLPAEKVIALIEEQSILPTQGLQLSFEQWRSVAFKAYQENKGRQSETDIITNVAHALYQLLSSLTPSKPVINAGEVFELLYNDLELFPPVIRMDEQEEAQAIARHRRWVKNIAEKVASSFEPPSKPKGLQWVRASGALPDPESEVYLKGCRTDKGKLKKIAGSSGREYVCLIYKDMFDEWKILTQWIVGHEELENIFWLDETNSPSPTSTALQELDQISDEDALAVAEIFGSMPNISDESKIAQVKQLLVGNAMYTKQTNIPAIKWYHAFEYLKQRSYKIYNP
jgi:hypothetical protein